MNGDSSSPDLGGLLRRLPHRYPFLMVDRVLELGDGRVLTFKNVSIDEPFFNGHFPGRPVMPGVLVVEAMAQSGALLALGMTGAERPAALFMLTGIDASPAPAGGARRSIANRGAAPQTSSPVVEDACGGAGGRRVGCRNRVVSDGSRGVNAIAGRIHPGAIIDRRAELDSSVEVGPGAVIGPEVRIGPATVSALMR